MQVPVAEVRLTCQDLAQALEKLKACTLPEEEAEP